MLPGLFAVCRTDGRISDFIQPFVADAPVIAEEITSNDNIHSTRNNDFFMLFISLYLKSDYYLLSMKKKQRLKEIHIKI
jgi:hypothetical protein